MSKKGNCTRDWGKGMACVGRTKVCSIVPLNHFGPIPGVPVGSLWKFRVQVIFIEVSVGHLDPLYLPLIPPLYLPPIFSSLIWNLTIKMMYKVCRIFF